MADDKQLGCCNEESVVPGVASGRESHTKAYCEAYHSSGVAWKADNSETPVSAGEGQAQPFAYAYRYPDGIRFDTGGRTINGSDSIEAIPLYLKATPPAPDLRRVVQKIIDNADNKWPLFPEDSLIAELREAVVREGMK